VTLTSPPSLPQAWRTKAISFAVFTSHTRSTLSSPPAATRSPSKDTALGLHEVGGPGKGRGALASSPIMRTCLSPLVVTMRVVAPR